MKIKKIMGRPIIDMNCINRESKIFLSVYEVYKCIESNSMLLLFNYDRKSVVMVKYRGIANIML